MRKYFLVLACALAVFCPTRLFAQVDCSTINQEEILHCDGPDDPTVQGIAGLSLQRGSNYHCYREPRIVITRTNGAQAVYPITGSTWQYTNNNQTVTTIFMAGVATFTMNSTSAFSPLAGWITIPSEKITFRTCGVQRTSAYYWTANGQYPLEAFSCPFSKIPKGCPRVGYNP